MFKAPFVLPTPSDAMTGIVHGIVSVGLGVKMRPKIRPEIFEATGSQFRLMAREWKACEIRYMETYMIF